MIFLPLTWVKILNRTGLLPLIRTGYTLQIDKTRFKIPVLENKEGLIYHQSVGEPFVLEILKKIYAFEKFVFLDAGVNFGQTLIKVKSINFSIPYLGFEPSALCAYYASRLIKANSIPEATVLKCALSDSQGVTTLYSETEGDTRASIAEGAHLLFDQHKEVVTVMSLDSLADIIYPLGENFLLKVDVEGAEWPLFQGANELINQKQPIVLFENLPEAESQSTGKQLLISNFFQEKQYRLFLLKEDLRTLMPIDRIENRSDYSLTNYLAVPEKKWLQLQRSFQ